MKHAILAAVAALGFALPALAHDYGKDGLRIDHPAIPAPLSRASTAAGYFTISNSGPEADRLLGVEAGVSRRVEVHTTEHGSDGTAKMVHVEALEIPAGGSVTFEPGSYHVMFIALTEALKEGSRIPGALIFEKAGKIEVEFAIEAPRKPGAEEDHSAHGHADHGDKAAEGDAAPKAKHSH